MKELTTAELASLDLDALPDWLEARAEAAHTAYIHLLNNPLLAIQDKKVSMTGIACRRWREAEDLAYLVVVASDAPLTSRAVG